MLKSIVVLFFVYALAVQGVSLCDKYATALGVNGSTLVGNVVDATVALAVDPANGIAKFFNGQVGTNFTGTPAALASLRAGLIAFFGSSGALNCTDGTTGNYTGGSLLTIHTPLNTTYIDYFRFNNALLSVLAKAGVTPDDVTAVATLLDTLRSGTCIFSDCTSICNKLIVPGITNSSAVISAVVNATVNAAVGSTVLLPYFTGQIGNHGDFTGTANAARLASLFQHLVQYFGSALGCSDGTIGAYTGQSLLAAHAGMNVSQVAFDTFNAALMGVIAGAIPPTNPDYNTIYGVLNSTHDQICTAPDCAGSATGSSSAKSSSGASTSGASSSGASSSKSSSGASSSGGSSSASSSGSASGSASSSSTSSTTPAPSSSTGFGLALVAPIFSLLSVFLF